MLMIKEPRIKDTSGLFSVEGLAKAIDPDSLNTGDVIHRGFEFIIKYYVTTGVLAPKDDMFSRVYMNLLYYYAKQEGWLDE